MITTAEVWLWGRQIGAVTVDERGIGAFEYVPELVGAGMEVAPLMMPAAAGVYSFPSLRGDTFHGLPGLLADSLPDRFGTALIDAWLTRQGRPVGGFNAVERLCYIGERGMGALTFRPASGPAAGTSEPLEVAELVELAAAVLNDRERFAADMTDTDPRGALTQLMQVGTSAGGARAKAVIAWNATTGEVRSGQVPRLPEGFEHWLLKFDGVQRNGDRGLADPQGYGVVEYVYFLLAQRAGLTMMKCRLLQENGRSHFMTRRFDRTDKGNRLHAQSLGAIAHLDYNQPTAHSYEQAFQVCLRLRLSYEQCEQMVRRMIFNVVARNQDDHVKNIAFLMNRQGEWSLAPAYDITWNYNPAGDWTRQHQMSINGRHDGFATGDLTAAAAHANVKASRVREIVADVVDAVRAWPALAAEHGVDAGVVENITSTHRLVW